ncbi:CCA tRNA nucleotidyltransferase [Helicobacter baculiformis]|uniref:CCA tRNA nucleotidyltransferase n=1 Tax=Helicobacter baculiformis TaxID=427351 RepID=A0ABV7ZJL6_9HELI|nr:CCA tRNA nucleotidyltransferase [Helicobacter baculiformis]
MAEWDSSFLSLVRHLPQTLLDLHARLEQGGFASYVVGGSVRDLLLGKKPKDYDLASSATPEQLKSVLAGIEGVSFIELGRAFGTLGVCYQGWLFEITTFRQESAYHDHRHPSGVVFINSLEKDLARRDFTINALALHPQKGLLDLHGGLEDLAHKRLKLVGDPLARLQEDALRILRALRFVSTLGFALEPATHQALKAQAPLLAHIAKERIRVEFFKLLLGGFVRLCAPFQPLLEHTLQTRFSPLERLEQISPNLCARLLWLCHTWESQTLLDFCARLKFSKKMRQSLHKLHAQLPLEPIENPNVWLKERLESLHLGQLRALLGFLQAQNPALSARLKGELKKIMKNHEVYSLRFLALKGTDLLERGFQGAQIGALLQACLQGVVRKEVRNEKEALLQYIQEYHTLREN